MCYEYENIMESNSLQVTVFIDDVNDSPPEFNQDVYEVAVSEGMPLMTTIFTVTATDPDSVGSHSIQYSLWDYADEGNSIKELFYSIITFTGYLCQMPLFVSITQVLPVIFPLKCFSL